VTAHRQNAGFPGDPPEGIEPMEVEEAPRRAASARFAVEAEVGSEAALRQAMDPANQSLAEALRLTYRVLLGAIVLLIVLFFVSGVQIVRQGYSGVMTRFGEVVKVDGRVALEPGRSFNPWPYPAGDFVTFQIENRPVDVGAAFWPRIPENRTLDQAIEEARATRGLRPGSDGSVLTGDGDLAHLKLAAEYEVSDPERFVRTLRDGDADRVVRLFLQRAVVEVTARHCLQDLLEVSEDLRGEVQRAAQAALDSIHCGIELTGVAVPDTKPPFAIVKAFQNLQEAREQARETVARARSEAQGTLEAASANYASLLGLVERYKETVGSADGALAEARLQEIGEALESAATTGRLSETIYRAKAYESEIDSTLGNEVKHFRSVLPSYRDHPDLVVKTRLLDTLATILGREDVEIYSVPPGTKTIHLEITGDEAVQQKRQELRLGRREREAIREGFERMKDYYETAKESSPGESRPMLEAERGRIRPRGTGP
jgi:regulator of protease activity HflC (stomatin/prohibitin superfamily)